jgi:hypothetical protein
MTGSSPSKGVDDIVGQHDVVTAPELVLAAVRGRAFTRKYP